MNNITTTDPEKFLENSKSDLFQIILVVPNGHFLYSGGGFGSMEHAGFNNGIVYERRDLVKSYWDASRFAKSDFGMNPMGNVPVEGVLHIIEIPKFGN